MTGFLGRMAARASGREPGITPRVPSRFEGADRAEPVAADGSSTEVAATSPVPVRPAAAPPRAEAVSGPPTEAAHRDPPPVMSPEGTAAAALPAPAPVRAEAPPASPPADPPSVEDVGPPRTRPREAPPKATSQPRSAPDLLVVPAAPAAALSSAAALVPAPGPVTADASPREPDVVHVSIGRVDVRATVAPPHRPAPPEQARPPVRSPSERLSLHDYLRGQREVG